MKRLIRSTILAGACLCALLLVQVTPVQAIEDCSTGCTGSTPCSTGCFDWGYTTCGEASYPCCEDNQFSGSGQCLTRHWKASTQVCKEKFYDWYQYTNYCTEPPTNSYSFVLVFAYNYSSTQEQCPEYDDCPS